MSEVGVTGNGVATPQEKPLVEMATITSSVMFTIQCRERAYDLEKIAA